jgi:hypothetical protein
VSTQLEERLAEVLDTPREPDSLLVARTLRAARAELRATAPRVFTAELTRLLAAALPAALLVALWNAAVLWIGPDLLSGFLPGSLSPRLAVALPTLYVAGAVGWLALLVGSLPAVAHRLAARRELEALAS